LVLILSGFIMFAQELSDHFKVGMSSAVFNAF